MKEIGRVFEIPNGYRGVLVQYLGMEGWKVEIENDYLCVSDNEGEFAGLITDVEIDARNSKLVKILRTLELE
jgi:hypothetical protein